MSPVPTKKTEKHVSKSDDSDKLVNQWSHHVMETSNAMDLEEGVFTSDNPKEIAESVLRSAKESKRKKGRSDLQSAMSMINFNVNRAGKNLPQERKDIINQSKDELRKIVKEERDEEDHKKTAEQQAE